MREQELMEVWDRRRFLAGTGLGVAAFLCPGAYAEALERTPRQTEGPFYPDKLPLDTDNDLLIISDALTPAVGEVTHFSGVVRDLQGEPVRNALVEIWQVDGHGVYLHSQAPKERQDKMFQGYGRFLTGQRGQYYFRTVKPVAYPGRAPHIHVAVSRKGKRVLTTQCYLQGDPRNEKDFLYRQLGQRQKLVTVPFVPLKGNAAQELGAVWDIVIGVTPEEHS